jgi:hypothetical protein
VSFSGEMAHSVIELQTFPEPPSDLIIRFERLLDEYICRRLGGSIQDQEMSEKLLENLEDGWIIWKQRIAGILVVGPSKIYEHEVCGHVTSFSFTPLHLLYKAPMGESTMTGNSDSEQDTDGSNDFEV